MNNNSNELCIEFKKLFSLLLDHYCSEEFYLFNFMLTFDLIKTLSTNESNIKEKILENLFILKIRLDDYRRLTSIYYNEDYEKYSDGLNELRIHIHDDIVNIMDNIINLIESYEEN